jgi:glycosidase
MHWRDEPGGGFTDPAARPWLPLGDTARNVEDQRADPSSMLHLGRDLLALRRRTPDLQVGEYAPLVAPAGVWAWRRGERHVVALNLAERDATVAGTDGRVLLGTDRDRDGEAVTGALLVRSHEALVVVENLPR